jgi:hypothetical protein
VTKKVKSIFVGSSNSFQKLTLKNIENNFASKTLDYFQIMLPIFILSFLYFFSLVHFIKNHVLLFILSHVLSTPDWPIQIGLSIRAYIFLHNWVDFPKCTEIGSWDRKLSENSFFFQSCQKCNWEWVLERHQSETERSSNRPYEHSD